MYLDVVQYYFSGVKLKSVAILHKRSIILTDCGKAFVEDDRFKFESVSHGNREERHFIMTTLIHSRRAAFAHYRLVCFSVAVLKLW